MTRTLSAAAWEAACDLWDHGCTTLDVWLAKARGPDAIPAVLAGEVLLLHARLIGSDR